MVASHDIWGEVSDDEDERFCGAAISVFRGIFDLALLSIVAVFLLKHDKHEVPLATTLAKCIAATCAASFVLDFVECFCWASPLEKSPLPSILHLLFACGRFVIFILGLVPKNVLKDIWVQYKKDSRGGVIISLLVILWLADLLYAIFAIEFLFPVLTFPCWCPWECLFHEPYKSLRKRAKYNGEVADVSERRSTRTQAASFPAPMRYQGP